MRRCALHAAGRRSGTRRDRDAWQHPRRLAHPWMAWAHQRTPPKQGVHSASAGLRARPRKQQSVRTYEERAGAACAAPSQPPRRRAERRAPPWPQRPLPRHRPRPPHAAPRRARRRWRCLRSDHCWRLDEFSRQCQSNQDPVYRTSALLARRLQRAQPGPSAGMPTHAVQGSSRQLVCTRSRSPKMCQGGRLRRAHARARPQPTPSPAPGRSAGATPAAGLPWPRCRRPLGAPLLRPRRSPQWLHRCPSRPPRLHAGRRRRPRQRPCRARRAAAPASPPRGARAPRACRSRALCTCPPHRARSAGSLPGRPRVRRSAARHAQGGCQRGGCRRAAHVRLLGPARLPGSTCLPTHPPSKTSELPGKAAGGQGSWPCMSTMPVSSRDCGGAPALPGAPSTAKTLLPGRRSRAAEALQGRACAIDADPSGFSRSMKSNTSSSRAPSSASITLRAWPGGIGGTCGSRGSGSAPAGADSPPKACAVEAPLGCGASSRQRRPLRLHGSGSAPAGAGSRPTASAVGPQSGAVQAHGSGGRCGCQQAARLRQARGDVPCCAATPQVHFQASRLSDPFQRKSPSGEQQITAVWGQAARTWSCSRDRRRQMGSGTNSARAAKNWPSCEQPRAQSVTARGLVCSRSLSDCPARPCDREQAQCTCMRSRTGTFR